MSAPIRYFMAIYGDDYRRIAAYSEQDARVRAAELLDKTITDFYETFPPGLPRQRLYPACADTEVVS